MKSTHRTPRAARLAVVAILLCLATPAQAVKITGRYTLSKAGKSFARSSFTLVMKSDQSAVGSEFITAPKKRELFGGFIQLRPKFALDKFRVRFGGKILRTEFLFRYKKAFKIRSLRGEKAKVADITVEPNAVILEPDLILPYVLLVRRYNLAQKGTQSFPYVVVSTRKNGTLSVAYQSLSEGQAKHLLTVSGMGWSAKLTLGEKKLLLKIETDKFVATHPSLAPKKTN